MESIATRLAVVQERIAAAARRAGRSATEITLVGVTKTQPFAVAAEALAAGLTHFGENRVQEAEEKIAALDRERPQITWHLIGHLQRNKAKKAAALFDMIHSVDSLRLAEALARGWGSETARTPIPQPPSPIPLPVLLQVNVSGEDSKEGFALAGWERQPAVLDAFLAEVEALLALPQLRVRGLMTIAPWSADPEQARPTFRAARRMRDMLARRFPQADWSAVSMGMTDDFEVAIEEGATIVRVGRAIFGERKA
ncbi:MAG TPA: YggS family pyridoxal phosphate-dependent enzyme [Roseiflexaceae bacterium]|nr:YggS family pyridoxal phosphate-dependent enzyme [Roseiflexaceae bacterium]